MLTRARPVRSRWLVVPLGVTAVVLGGAAAATVEVERRLAAAIPGTLSVRALHYNPLGGALRLADVQVRDAAGGLVLDAQAVRARLSPRGLLAGRLVLRDLEVVAPRLTIRLAAGDELATGLGASLGEAGRVSLRGLVVTGGTVRVERGSGAGGLVLRDVAARAHRVLAGRDTAVAFVASLRLADAVVHLTGQPVAGRAPASGPAYVVRLRARDVDVAALQRGLAPAAAAVRVDRARADVDAELVSAAGRTFLSGRARLRELVARAPTPSVSPLRADEVVVAVDRFDVAARAGRLARLELRSPSLTIRRTPEGVGALRRVTTLLPDVVVRRLRIRDGAVTLVDRRRRRALRGLDVTLQAREGPGESSLRLALAGTADGRAVAVERALPGGGASLMSALVEIADAVDIVLAD